MSWVSPEFRCGECGGRVARWPMTNLLKQQILDWRHIDPDPSVEPHRAVLGTPGPRAIPPLLGPQETPDEADEPVRVGAAPPPEVPARPAMADDLPPAAKQIDRLADEHGWTVEAWFMRGTRMDSRWKPGRVVSSVVLRMHRDGHRLIACWQTSSERSEEMSFDTAYSLTHHSEIIGSPELRRLIKLPRAVCEECGEPPTLHTLTPSGLVCHTSPNTEQRRTSCPSE